MRRSILIAVFAFGVFVATLIVGGAFDWILTIDNMWIRLSVLTFAVAAVLLSLLRGLRAFNKVRVAQKAGIHLVSGYKDGSVFGKASSPSRSRSLIATGAFAGAGAAAGSDALGGLLALAAIFIYGDLLAALLVVCLKYTPREFPAVLALEKWKAEHPEWIEDRPS